MSYNLFLDDIRDPINAFHQSKDRRYTVLDWVIVRDSTQFINYIKKNGVPDLISFDHDLADEHYDIRSFTDFQTWEEYYLSNDRELTGYDCAKWLCEYCKNNYKIVPDIIVHSANTVGKMNIITYINNFLKHNPHLK